eukprot:2357100-Rhodomonas_salina.2
MDEEEGDARILLRLQAVHAGPCAARFPIDSDSGDMRCGAWWHHVRCEYRASQNTSVRRQNSSPCGAVHDLTFPCPTRSTAPSLHSENRGLVTRYRSSTIEAAA